MSASALIEDLCSDAGRPADAGNAPPAPHCRMLETIREFGAERCLTEAMIFDALRGRRSERVPGRGADLGVLLAVLAAGLLLGVVTSFAQGVLPFALAPLANSASGWTLVTVLVLLGVRPRTLALSAVAGLICFLALVQGYTAASTVRGLFFNPLFWSLVGVPAGPVVGAATAALRMPDRRAHLGAGLLAGIAIGEGIYGLTMIRETTGWFYWLLVLVLGFALQGFVIRRRPRPSADVLAGVGTAAGVAGAFWVAFQALGAVPLTG